MHEAGPPQARAGLPPDADHGSTGLQSRIGRRQAIRAAGAMAVADAAPIPDAPREKEHSIIAALAEAFIARWKVPGLSIAIGRDGAVAYSAAFGTDGAGIKLATTHRFRIASLSKPLTAVAVLKLVEQGRLHLLDPVFGRDGVLRARFGQGAAPGLTVDHLLTHTGGAWPNDEQDPMFQRPELDQAALIDWVLATRQPVRPPGEAFAYSNFGYCLLGRVVEAASGLPYSAFVAEHVLEPSAAQATRIGGDERQVDEVVYLGDETTGEDPYGRIIDLARMDSHGGWVGTATDLVRVALALNRANRATTLLSPPLVAEMDRPSLVTPAYARGWQANSAGYRWHNGSLPGTTTLLVRAPDGLCWAALTNVRRRGDMARRLDELAWIIAHRIAG